MTRSAAMRGLLGRPQANTPPASALPAEDKIVDLINGVQAAFTAYRAANDARLAQIESGRGEDAATRASLEKAETDVGRLQASIDDMNQRLAALSAGAGSANDNRHRVDGSPEETAYANTFSPWFRRGRGEIDAAMRDLPRAAVEGMTDAAGGALAPIEWDRTIQRELTDVSPIRQLATVVSISTRGFERLYQVGAVASGWVAEDGARAETATPNFQPLAFNAMEMFAQPAATQRMLDDAEVDLSGWFAGEIAREFADLENTAFIAGNAATQPRGLLTFATGGANATTHPLGAIPVVSTGADVAAGLNYAGLVDLVYGLPSVYARGATLVANRNSMGGIRKIVDTTGQPIWQPSMAAGQPSTVLGYPSREVVDMPNFAANSLPVAFGDFRRGYLIVDRIGVRILRDPYTSKPYVLFYATKRVGGGVNDPLAFRIAQAPAA